MYTIKHRIAAFWMLVVCIVFTFSASAFAQTLAEEKAEHSTYASPFFGEELGDGFLMDHLLDPHHFVHHLPIYQLSLETYADHIQALSTGHRDIIAEPPDRL